LIVLIIIGSLIGLAIISLCIPVELDFAADLGTVRRFRVNIVWLFGMVRLSPKRRGRRARAQALAKKKNGLLSRQFQQLQTILRIVRTRGLARQVLKLLVSMLKEIRFRRGAVDLKVGLGDPGDTGMLFSVIGPVTPLLNWYAPFPVNIQPLMADEPGITGRVYSKLSLQPIRIAVPVLGFLLSRPGFRLMRIMVAQRWKKKR